jgi:Sodium/hydrogen exchanger family.
VFFAAMGMLINPAHIIPILLIAIVISVLAVFGKFIAGLSVLRLQKTTMSTAVSASTFLIPRGEVAMIVAGYGVAIGACPPEFLSIGALIMIITTLITIFLYD